MTKVEEAVKKMIEEFEALAGIELFIANDLDEAIDNLILAARAEGFAEGVEDTTADLTLVQDAEAFARGRAEGAEQERERIRAANTGTFFTTEYTIPKAAFDVPASLLAPATKSVPSATIANHDGPVTSDTCSIENAGYVQTSDKESK